MQTLDNPFDFWYNQVTQTSASRATGSAVASANIGKRDNPHALLTPAGGASNHSLKEIDCYAQ